MNYLPSKCKRLLKKLSDFLPQNSIASLPKCSSYYEILFATVITNCDATFITKYFCMNHLKTKAKSLRSTKQLNCA